MATPAPSIPEAERLETLRLDHLSGMSLAEFHRQLTSSGSYRVSYAAVRNYHSHRKAPVDYYAQVSRVFDVRLEWLLFGEGKIKPVIDSVWNLAEAPMAHDRMERGDQFGKIVLRVGGN